jgi:hypothetical protein
VPPNNACRRRGYRRALAKVLVIPASLAREGSGNTRPAPDAESLCREKGAIMSTPRHSIDEVWRRIKALEGNTFETKTGLPFTFKLAGDVFHPSRTQYNIAKSDFGKALDLVPFEGPGIVNRLVRGPTYVWAVLHDRRVRRQDW